MQFLSSIYIISTLFYCLTIEQFLMQPDPGCTTKCIKNCTFSDLGCIINCTLSDFGCIINCTPPDFGCIKKCTPSRNCALENATYFESKIFFCFLRCFNNYNQIPHSSQSEKDLIMHNSVDQDNNWWAKRKYLLIAFKFAHNI